MNTEKELSKKIITKLENFRLNVIQKEKELNEHNKEWEEKFSEHSTSEPYYSSYSSCDEQSNEFENLKSWWERNFDIVCKWNNQPRFKNDDLLEVIDYLLDELKIEVTDENKNLRMVYEMEKEGFEFGKGDD